MEAQQVQMVYRSLFLQGGIPTGLDFERKVNSGLPKKINETQKVLNYSYHLKEELLLQS